MYQIAEATGNKEPVIFITKGPDATVFGPYSERQAIKADA
jgi:hypothetical protein